MHICYFVMFNIVARPFEIKNAVHVQFRLLSIQLSKKLVIKVDILRFLPDTILCFKRLIISTFSNIFFTTHFPTKNMALNISFQNKVCLSQSFLYFICTCLIMIIKCKIFV